MNSLAGDTKKTLQEVGRKLLILYAPWPLWIVSGHRIAGAQNSSATRQISATNDAGREILSYVPPPHMADFLSKNGQALVSSHLSALTDNLSNPQVTNTMSSTRSSHINRLQTHASLIFGSGFEQDWFTSKYKRGSIEKLQELLGANVTSKGKKYPLLPPILFPNGSRSKKDIFLNPALVRVSVLSYQAFATWYTHKM